MSLPDPTELILRVFRVNGALLVAGDRLVAGLGLTSARWQLLGEIAGRHEPMSVAELARRMGHSRQAVQRIANELSTAGMICFRTNPRHKRAQLVALTEEGARLFEQSLTLQRPWALDLASGLTPRQLDDACATLDALLDALGRSPPGR